MSAYDPKRTIIREQATPDANGERRASHAIKAEIVRLEETLDATADKVRKYAPSRLTHAKL